MVFLLRLQERRPNLFGLYLSKYVFFFQAAISTVFLINRVLVEKPICCDDLQNQITTTLATRAIRCRGNACACSGGARV